MQQKLLNQVCLLGSGDFLNQKGGQMSDLNVKFESKELDMWLDRVVRRQGPELAEAVRKTALFGVAIAKRYLPGKSGLLRKSLLAERKTKFSYLVWHGRNTTNGRLKYADVIEAGTKSAYTVAPKRRKSLLFAINDKARNLDGTVKAGAKRRLFDELSKRSKLILHAAHLPQFFSLPRRIIQTTIQVAIKMMPAMNEIVA